jgi:thiopurine S-methyltransferase
MDTDFWLTKWQRNEIGFHEGAPNAHLQRHWKHLGLAQGSRVLVPLCGKSLDLAWLAGQGLQVLGVELSAQAVEAFFQEHGLTASVHHEGELTFYRAGPIELVCGDFFALPDELIHGCQACYDRAALVALPPALRRAYARRLQLLPNGARMLLVTMEYPRAQMDGPPFSVEEAEVTALYEDGFEFELLARENALPAHPKLAERGLQRLQEAVWALRRVG